MDKLRELLPLLVPILLIQLALMVVALVDLIRRPKTRGPKWLWAVIIVLVNLLGPVLYFAFGRQDE